MKVVTREKETIKQKLMDADTNHRSRCRFWHGSAEIKRMLVLFAL